MKQLVMIGAVFSVAAFGTPASAACLTRSVTDASGIAKPMVIVAPDGEIRAYSARGFAVTPCTLTAAQMAYERDEMCKATKLGNDAVQKRLEQVVGASPKQMCASAQAVLGSAAVTPNNSPLSN